MFRFLAVAVLSVLFSLPATAQIVPYYGKNNVKYDTFDWKTYKTQHFEIFFYPESEEHLQRVASMAESAYEKISAQLQHDIEFRIPLIFFKTGSEFEQVSYLQITEGILGAAEPVYNRMAFAIDQPSDKLQELILHELGHVFEFSMLFGGSLSPIIRMSPPLWIMEGFAEHLTGVWDASDLMVVRDAVLTERLPYLSVAEDMIFPGGAQLGRAPYNVGHAAFQFIEDKYGEAAIRQFWFYMKKATLLGGEDVIYSTLGIKEETFNEQFANYLREKFKDYRDRQSPLDYGTEVILPNKYAQIFSQVPSPDGKEFLVLTSNREDYEFDLLKVDRDGKILKNLTGGFTTSFDYLTFDSFTFDGRNLAWSSDGSKIAYFARTGKRRSLFLVDAKDGDRIKRIKLKIDQAASPSFSPDGTKVLFTGLREGIPDLFMIDIQSEQIQALTDSIIYEKTPYWSPDGKSIYYTARISSRDQIFRMDPSHPQDTEQLTFSDYDSTSPFYDPDTNSIFYSANRGGAYNIYKLDLNTGQKIEYTDVIGGNFSPVVYKQNGKQEIAFTSFFKGQYRFFLMDLPEPIQIIAAGAEETESGLETTSEQLAQGFGLHTVLGNTQEGGTTQGGSDSQDYKPAKELTIDKSKIKDKDFRLVLSGRPSVVTGVSGDSFAVAGGVVLQDILGDQEWRFFTSRIRGFQSYNVGYLDLRHRYQYLSDFIFNDDFFFSPLPLEVAEQTGFNSDIVKSRTWGGRVISQYPFSRYYRVELGAGIFDLSQHFYDPAVQNLYEAFLARTNQKDVLNNGGYLPLSVALVGETTRFREFGPLSGFTFRLSVDYSPAIKSDWISRTIYELDLRKYIRMTSRSLLAGRFRFFYSDGKDPVIFSYGGGLDVRGFDFREIVATKGGIGNFEYRFPVFPNPTIPVLSALRARLFVDYFQTRFSFPNRVIIEGIPEASISRTVDNRNFFYDPKDGVGSVGIGITFFAGGLPLNFDFSKNYGYGRFGTEIIIGQPLVPSTFKFADGFEFDFSIGYDF